MSDPGQQERSLGILVLADCTGDAAPPGGGAAVLRLDKQGLADVIERLGPRLDLVLEPATPQARAPRGRLEASLRFAALRDFEPLSMLRQVPALAAAHELREMCAGLASGELDAAEFRRRAQDRLPAELSEALIAELTREVAAAPAGGVTPGPVAALRGSVDAILELVAQPGAVPAKDAARLADELAGAVTSGRVRPGRPGPAGRIESRLGAHVSSLLDALLAEPRLKALESAWRGIAFLVERADFREPIRIALAPTGIDGAADALRGAASSEDYDLALAAFELDASARDLERARQLAEAAMESQTPLVIGVAPAFLGVASFSELRRGELPQARFAAPAYSGWRSLREREPARWLNLVANRLVLRAPYGPEGRKARELEYVEQGARPGCLATGAWAVGATLLRAFARTGNCVAISGTRNGLVPDLPLAPAQGAAGGLPVEGALGTERVEDLERIGVCAVDHYQRDIAYVGTLRCFRQPERYPDAEASADALQHVTLSYQLYASRLAKFLARTLPEVAGMDADQIAQTLRARIVEFLSTPGRPLDPRRVGLAAARSTADPSATEIKLRVAPDLKIAGRDVNVMFAFTLRV